MFTNPLRNSLLHDTFDYLDIFVRNLGASLGSHEDLHREHLDGVWEHRDTVSGTTESDVSQNACVQAAVARNVDGWTRPRLRLKSRRKEDDDTGVTGVERQRNMSDEGGWRRG